MRGCGTITCTLCFVLVTLPSCTPEASNDGFRLLESNSDEEWTILCQEFVGPTHSQDCLSYAESLRRTPGIKTNEVYCRDDDLHSTSRLYYGSYRRKVNRKTGERSMPAPLVEDIQLIQNLGDSQGNRFFMQARPTLATAPASGPSQWDLTNASGAYSLQIAVFYPESGFSESRQAAVDLVKDLRNQGHEAYYYHGEVQSMVTVGSFGEQAVAVTSEGKYKDAPKVNALRGEDKRFKYNYENGRVVTRIVNGQRIPSKSFLVRIPRRGETMP